MPTFVSLYTGAGGLDLGFIAAGFTPVFSNDINADAMLTYSAALDMIAERQGAAFARSKACLLREAPISSSGGLRAKASRSLARWIPTTRAPAMCSTS